MISIHEHATAAAGRMGRLEANRARRKRTPALPLVLNRSQATAPHVLQRRLRSPLALADEPRLRSRAGIQARPRHLCIVQCRHNGTLTFLATAALARPPTALPGARHSLQSPALALGCRPHCAGGRRGRAVFARKLPYALPSVPSNRHRRSARSFTSKQNRKPYQLALAPDAGYLRFPTATWAEKSG